MREQWVKELRDKRRAKAIQISTCTDKNVADMMTKCLTTTVLNKLQMEIDILAQLNDVGNGEQTATTHTSGQAIGQSLSITRQKGGPIVLLSVYHATWQERPHLR